MSVHLLDEIGAAGALHDPAIRTTDLPPDWMNVEALKAALARLLALREQAETADWLAAPGNEPTQPNTSFVTTI